MVEDNTKDLSIFHREYFLGFSADSDQDAAKKKFKNRFGYDPEMCEVSKGLLWVGPIYNHHQGDNHDRTNTERTREEVGKASIEPISKSPTRRKETGIRRSRKPGTTTKRRIQSKKRTKA